MYLFAVAGVRLGVSSVCEVVVVVVVEVVEVVAKVCGVLLSGVIDGCAHHSRRRCYAPSRSLLCKQTEPGPRKELMKQLQCKCRSNMPPEATAMHMQVNTPPDNADCSTTVIRFTCA